MTSESEWQCDKCGYTDYYGYEDIAEIGAPVCPNDGEHMSFIREYPILPENSDSAPLTLAQLKRYYETGDCPFCYGDIEGGSFDVDGGGAYQKIRCLACGASIIDYYELAGVEVESYPNRIPEEP